MRILKSALSAFLLLNFFQLSAQSSAKDIIAKALSYENSGETLSYIKKTIPQIQDAKEKRALLTFLASVHEQLSAYKDASDCYAQAAGISASPAASDEFFYSKTSPELVLDAVRTALCAGDAASADSYLNSAVRNSSDEKIQSRIKLYEVWSALCKLESSSRLEESVAILKAYSDLPSMKSVQPSVLLTLWYITGESSYGKKLDSLYPKSMESAIVHGSVQMMPAPFWYFMPKRGQALQTAAGTAAESEKITIEKSADTDSDGKSEKIKKQQLGLFKSRANAESLVQRAGGKGFKPYITEETRPSGTTYYIVVVDENADGTIGEQLRSAGFDCYPVF